MSVLWPVPPPPTPSVPASELAKVHVTVTHVMVVDAVRPLKAVLEVAKRSDPVN